MTANLNIPDHQLTLLTEFVEKLAERFRPLHVFSFGYNSTAKTCNGCFTGEQSSQEHQHFLFMITESNARIDHEVQDFANAYSTEVTITILCHGIINVTEGINNNNKFFKTLRACGHVLYFKGMLPPMSSFNSEDRNFKLEVNTQYHRRKRLANGFLNAAQLNLQESNYTVAVFLMHQCIEQCTIMLIQAFTGYKSQLHNLKRQLQLCNCFSPAPYQHFLSGGTENERLFDLLMKSYANARYKDDFGIQQRDAEALFIRVSTFEKLAEVLCEPKLKD